MTSEMVAVATLSVVTGVFWIILAPPSTWRVRLRKHRRLEFLKILNLDEFIVV